MHRLLNERGLSYPSPTGHFCEEPAPSIQYICEFSQLGLPPIEFPGGHRACLVKVKRLYPIKIKPLYLIR